ncbi:PilN domain-containing protein [bacterium]|nr:PilN domain-containing protein [candidate division CSSED10-310 bacterium]
MIRINMLPHERKKTSVVTIELIAAGALIFVVLVGVGIWAHYLTTVLDEKVSTIDRKTKQVEELQVIIDQVIRYEQDIKALENKVNTIKQLKENQTGPVLMLDELNRRLPEEIWFTQLRTAGDLISIRGFGLSQTSIGDFMSSLEGSPYFHSINLKIATLKTMLSREIYEFELDFRSRV